MTIINITYNFKGGGVSTRKLLIILFVIVLILSVQACSDSANKHEDTVFKQIPQIQEIKPEKPPKIKLKRDSKESYSWEISGDNVDEIIEADKKLRKNLK